MESTSLDWDYRATLLRALGPLQQHRLEEGFGRPSYWWPESTLFFRFMSTSIQVTLTMLSRISF